MGVMRERVCGDDGMGATGVCLERSDTNATNEHVYMRVCKRVRKQLCKHVCKHACKHVCEQVCERSVLGTEQIGH